ncbi:MAG: hypothetical protein L6R37_004760 [Teloschistes peruensis]|nr:MAG: hypothetical protein L6R37_004760 [Teloschistes peruensis]
MSLPRPFTLPTSLFNPTLYTRLLQLWFTPLPPTASSASQTQLSRWFGMGTLSEKASFDAECASTALPALDSISSTNFPLPPFQNPEHDRETNYKAIAEPFLSQFNTTAPDADADEGEKEVRNAETALGLVLLLDQIPRNIFRTQQQAIYTHYDRISRAIAYAIYALGLDTSSATPTTTASVPWKNSPVWLAWFYLPLMHSESLADHNLFDAKMSAMQTRAQSREDGGEEAVGYIARSVEYERKHRVLLERFGRYPHRNAVLGREGTREEKGFLEGGGERFGAG